MLVRQLQDGLGVSGGVGVEVRATADDRGAHLEGVPQHGQTVRAGHPGEYPRHRDRGQLGEPAQRPARLEDGLQRPQPLDVADPYVGAQGRRAVAELQERRLGGAALHVFERAGDGAGGVGGQRGVAVRVRLGGGREQQVAAEVDAGAVRGEAARRADRLDAPAAEPYVHHSAVGEPGVAEHQGACRGARAVAARGLLGPRLRLTAVGHRAPRRTGRARSRSVVRA